MIEGTVLAAGTTTQVNFFQVPLGGGTPAKNELSTNMDQGGSLPYPKNFELHAIRCVNAYAATVADLILIYNNAWFRLFIGTKNYLVVNLFMLTAGVGLAGLLTGSVGTASAQNGKADQRGIYVLAEPIDLIPQQNFRCEVNFPTAQTPSANTNLSIYLDGFFKREVH